MWLKLLLCAAIVAFCVGIGYLAGEKYRSRKKFYARFLSFHERYLNELTYARTPLAEFLAAEDLNGDFGKLLNAVRCHETPNAEFSYLTAEERKGCAEYFSMLGKGDSASQRGYFGSKTAELFDKKTKAEEEAKRRGELALKLGLLAGLAVVILII